ncbi:hypothetical protein CEXT_250671 [Caerostris extrusa]|uniref:Uncharacterized protein n=1 Tax=Caerostris extrusa TaxID=172846 RepID=A0AAV4NUU6_CAEEX|nr:hypothetical protein CEXT_250671 [Caerostris extrusa]
MKPKAYMIKCIKFQNLISNDELKSLHENFALFKTLQAMTRPKTNMTRIHGVNLNKLYPKLYKREPKHLARNSTSDAGFKDAKAASQECVIQSSINNSELKASVLILGM